MEWIRMQNFFLIEFSLNENILPQWPVKDLKYYQRNIGDMNFSATSGKVKLLYNRIINIGGLKFKSTISKFILNRTLASHWSKIIFHSKVITAWYRYERLDFR